MSTSVEHNEQPRRVSRRKKALLTIYEIAVFGMLGALMMVSDILMNIIPNVHLVGVMIVLLIGLVEGAGLWFIYCYVWAILWGMVMLLPKRMPKWLAPIVYALVCGLHGFAFGFLLIPYQMTLVSFTFKQALVWWQFGFLTADIPHGIGNMVGSTLVVPLVTLIRKLDRRVRHG